MAFYLAAKALAGFHTNRNLQVILVPPSNQDLPDGIQARDGLTPPMRDAVNRRFRKLKHVEPGVMRHVEEAILTIASVHLSQSPALSHYPNLSSGLDAIIVVQP